MACWTVANAAYRPEGSSEVEWVCYILCWVKHSAEKNLIIASYHPGPIAPQRTVILTGARRSRWTQAEDKAIVTAITAIKVTA